MTKTGQHQQQPQEPQKHAGRSHRSPQAGHGEVIEALSIAHQLLMCAASQWKSASAGKHWRQR